jgi:hypothetical protein
MSSWEEVQEKAFTHWVNSYLTSSGGDAIEDISTAFETGVKLVEFLEKLTKKEFETKWYRNPKLKIQYIENLNLCLRFIQNEGIKGLTVSAEDFTDGRIKMILGFCWILLRHFGRPSGDGDDRSFEESLLTWLTEQLEDYELEIKDFKNSFNDGKALLALAHKWDPDSFDYFDKDLTNSLENANQALGLIEKNVRVPSLLDPKSLTKGETREKQIVLYLSLIQKSFTDEEEKRRLAGEGQAKVLSLREQLNILNEENSTMTESVSVLQEKVDVLSKMLENESEEKNELKQETETLQAAKDSLETEKKSLTAERDDLVKQLSAAKRAREELEEAVASATKRNGMGLETIRKNVLEHVSDLAIWKEFLEQDRDYKSETADLPESEALAELEFGEQVKELAKAVTDENKRLESLLVIRREEEKNQASMFSDEVETEPEVTSSKKKKKSKK